MHHQDLSVWYGCPDWTGTVVGSQSDDGMAAFCLFCFRRQVSPVISSMCTGWMVSDKPSWERLPRNTDFGLMEAFAACGPDCSLADVPVLAPVIVTHTGDSLDHGTLALIPIGHGPLRPGLAASDIGVDDVRMAPASVDGWAQWLVSQHFAGGSSSSGSFPTVEPVLVGMVQWDVARA